VVPVSPFGKSAAPPEAPLKSVAVHIPVILTPVLVVSSLDVPSKYS